MGASRERNGSRPLGTLEIGRTTAKRALAFSSTKTETNTKACGHKTAGMDRELTGGMKVESSGGSIRVIGTRIRSMEEALSSIRTEIGTMATGSMGCHREREE